MTFIEYENVRVNIYDNQFTFLTKSPKLDDLSDTNADNPDIITLNDD